jgi:polysaccharide biosynthesis transport protein
MKNFQDLSIRDYFGILRRRLWYFVVPAVLISAGACVFAWFQAPFYKSETTIQVTNRLLPNDYIDSLIRETPADRIEFVRQQIRSRTFIERLVEDLQLAGPEANRELVVSAVGASISIDVFPPSTFKLGYVARDAALAQSVVRRLAERVMQLNANFRKATVEGADQFLDEEVRQAANDLAQVEEKLRLFNEQNFRGLPTQVDVFSLTALQNQLTNAASELGNFIQSREAVRRRLQEQRELRLAGRPPVGPSRRTSTPTPVSIPKPATSSVSPLELQLASRQADLARMSPTHPDRPRLNREVEKLEQQVAELKKSREEAAVAVSRESLTAPTDEENPGLPPLPGLDVTVEFVEAELKFELDRLDRVINEKERAKQILAGQVAQSLRRLNLPAGLAQEMAAINQDLKNARDRHTLLANKKLSSELAAKVDTNSANETFRTVDAANLPQVPAGPNRPRNAALGSIAGILLGLGLVMAREYMDNTLLDEEEASALLKLPVLTSVPVVAAEAKKGLQRLRGGQPDPAAAPEPEVVKADLITLGLEPASTFSLQGIDSKVRSVILDHRTIAGEQYRLMRTSLSLMRKKRDKLQTILIASTIPNEGKTFAACCLAAILAQESGKRVLLIDADFRTASASSVLGLNGNAPRTGFSDVLRGEAQIENSVAACTDLNLYFLSAGRTITDPTEVLALPSLESTIRRCEELFDWILIDSPPILALADANILLPVCDSALLVVRAGKTPAKLIQDSVSRIGDNRICGVLMNGVRNITPSRYYGNYYKYNS